MMRMTFGRSRFLGLVLVALVAVATIAVTADASVNCSDKQQGCFYSIQVDEYTGPPNYPCQTGHPVVTITLNAQCGGGGRVQVIEHLCGVQDDPVSVTSGNKTVMFQPVAGEDWEAVLNGDCSLLEIDVHN